MPPDEAGASQSLGRVLPASELGVFAGVVVVPLLRSVVNKEAMRTSMLLLRCFVILSLRCGPAKVLAFTGTYGINYGRLADNLPSPERVVTLLKAAKIKNVRIYDADHSVLNAFKGSGLDLTVAIGNEYLRDISVNEDHAVSWIRYNVQSFLPDTRIRGIVVGNEVLGSTDQELAQALFGAIKNVYNGLKRLQLADNIEVSTPHAQFVFANSFPPSSCIFKEDVLGYMKPILDFFSQIGSPFYLNAYPFLAYKYDPEHIDINYALFLPNHGVYDSKTDLHYDNLLDAQIDAAYAALEAAGYDKMEVRISETGWASASTDNETGATIQNARTYNFNLRKRLFKKKGTPLRPKIVVKAYIFALFNEDMKPNANSEKHYGLFEPNGSIAYDIGYSGLKSSSASPTHLTLKDIYTRDWLSAYNMVHICFVAVVLVLTI
ncbi:glucan endo-1,3-beta-glucosidase 14-like [Zingiber officinale]|uniref:glucan endo-1,3-beta-glucosidase 14-like n=1 Tax=Zingiber officinale TaxID=94328 RepID=UPI001C4C5D70|nr:glucan endo-1,3-beta-glucosidase 14-like [Zingiber officinale]